MQGPADIIRQSWAVFVRKERRRWPGRVRVQGTRGVPAVTATDTVNRREFGLKGRKAGRQAEMGRAY